MNSNSFNELVTNFGEMYDRNVKGAREISRFSVQLSFLELLPSHTQHLVCLGIELNIYNERES